MFKATEMLSQSSGLTKASSYFDNKLWQKSVAVKELQKINKLRPYLENWDHWEHHVSSAYSKHFIKTQEHIYENQIHCLKPQWTDFKL